MREQLQKSYKEKIEVIAIYKKYAVTGNKIHLLFKYVRNSDNIELTDHCWIKLSDIEKFNYKDKNITYKFFAIVEAYYKLNAEGERVKDYCLTNITGVEVVQ